MLLRPKHQNGQHFIPCIGNGVEMAGTAILVIHAIIQFDRLIPVIDIGICVKAVISGSFGRELFIRFGSSAFHIKLSMQFRLRNIIEVVIRAERIIRIVICSQLRSPVRLHIRMILTRYVVGNEVDDNLQPAAMSALHQIFKFSHAFGNVFRQIWVYIIIVFYCVWRTGFAFYDSRMIGADVVAMIIRLCCMFNNAGIPNMGSTQLFDFS